MGSLTVAQVVLTLSHPAPLHTSTPGLGQATLNTRLDALGEGTWGQHSSFPPVGLAVELEVCQYITEALCAGKVKPGGSAMAAAFIGDNLTASVSK